MKINLALSQAQYDFTIELIKHVDDQGCVDEFVGETLTKSYLSIAYNVFNVSLNNYFVESDG
jgi:hypothetical protein